MSVLDPMRVEKNAWKGWVRASLITSSFACLMIGGLFLSFKLGYDSNITIWVPPTENIGNQE